MSANNNERKYIQLIDGEGKYLSEFDSLIHKSGLKGNEYAVLAVFGCQSSGKSTLLNKLFNTDFPTMNANVGVTQTTKGICAAKPQDSSIFMFDMEGTDSNERGEEDRVFERKISLFALAIAEVLLINIWYKDIGRYNASNYALLKSVFELNLQLFQRSKVSRMLLLFIIRDHDTDTPIEVLQTQIMANIDKLWVDLIKPHVFQDSKIQDFFDISFYALPHYKYNTVGFNNGVDTFRKMLCEPQDPGYLFKSEYKKSVPVDGLSHYAESIWDVIQKNKDLDIPTQKEMLADYRCGQIHQELLTTYLEECEKLSTQIQSGVHVKELGKDRQDSITKLLADFTLQTELYFQDVVEKKLKEFEDVMKSHAKELFTAQLIVIRKNVLKSFESSLLEVLPKNGEEKIVPNYVAEANKRKSDAIASFVESAKAASLPTEQSNWSFELEQETLSTDIDAFIAQHRKEQLQLLHKLEKKKAVNTIVSLVTPFLEYPSSDMWKKIRSAVNEKLAVLNSDFVDSLKGFEASTEEEKEMLESIHKIVREGVKNRVRNVAVGSILSVKLSKKFEDGFIKTSDGILRVWRPKENILDVFKEARNNALTLLDIFFLFRFDNENLDNVHLQVPQHGEENQTVNFPNVSEPQDMLLLEKEEVTKLFDRFSSEIATYYIKAITEQVANTKSVSLPWWLIPIVIVLGWNEIMYIISRPLLLLLLLGLGFAFVWFTLKTEVENYLATGPSNIVLPIRFVLEALPIKLFDVKAKQAKVVATATITSTSIPTSSSSSTTTSASTSATSVSNRLNFTSASEEQQQ